MYPIDAPRIDGEYGQPMPVELLLYQYMIYVLICFHAVVWGTEGLFSKEHCSETGLWWSRKLMQEEIRTHMHMPCPRVTYASSEVGISPVINSEADKSSASTWFTGQAWDSSANGQGHSKYKVGAP